MLQVQYQVTIFHGNIYLGDCDVLYRHIYKHVAVVLVVKV